MNDSVPGSRISALAEQLVAQFGRLVAREGGAVSLLAVAGDTIRIGYRPGVDPSCAEGVCVLPHVELETLIAETLRRRDPTLKVAVELLK